MRSRTLLWACIFIIMTGCGGDENTTGTESDGWTSGGKLEVNLVRPSPCKRISGDLVINVEVKSSLSVRKVYITLNDQVKAIFDTSPYAVVIFASDLPPDGTYTIKAIAEDSGGNVSSDETEINIDLALPYRMSVLVVDADADPYGFGDNPGAVFRINPLSGTVCTLAASEKFANPMSMKVGGSSKIGVTDLSAYKDDEGGPGTGAVFEVWGDRKDYVEPVAISEKFEAPVGMDLSPANTIYVADFNANPKGFDLDNPPGAIFSVKGGIVSTVVSEWPMVSPIGVTQKSGGGLWIVDSDAEPLSGKLRDNQTRGCLFDYDGANLNVAASSSGFITPWHVEENPDGTLTMTDSGNNVTPGRMFTVDPGLAAASAATVLKSGAPFRKPSGFIRLTDDSGDPYYLIADRAAQCGAGSGAILRYEPIGDKLTCEYWSELFVAPMDVAISPE